MVGNAEVNCCAPRFRGWLAGLERVLLHALSNYRVVNMLLIRELFRPADEKTVDTDVCTCCPTGLVSAEFGGGALYRGHTSEEIRDIQVARLVNGAWEQPHAVHDDHWKINGCPVNGPALSERKGRLTLAWFTGENDELQVQLAFSGDSGKRFKDLGFWTRR
jgi:hypothetical protein